jgi:PAS domain S-box-containing protein
MAAPDSALDEVRRPFLAANLWVPLLLILVACGAIAYEGFQVAKTLRQSVADAAKAQGQATAREIGGLLTREHERLAAFVVEKEADIRLILRSPDDWPVVEGLQTSLKRMFRGSLAFTVTDAEGHPLFEDFEGLVGPICEAAMRDFARPRSGPSDAQALPPIHPVPEAYHFDLITPWTLENGESGLFFVSMSPDRIAELIAAAEVASGSRILLVNRNDPSLIEVSANGARDRLGSMIRLPEEELVEGHYAIDLPDTHWRLLVLPDGQFLQAELRHVYLTVGALIASLLLISVTLLYLIRRFEARNSTLFMRSLQSSVSRQRAILQSMVDGMVTIDSSGRIHDVNNAVTRLFGYEPRELIGSNVRVLMPEPDHSAHDGYLRHYLDTGESKILGKGREVVARRKDGSVFPALLTLGESMEDGERMFVGILHDMTAYNAAQRKIIAQAIEIRRSSEELDEISKIAADNLHRPLQRIASLGEALRASQHDALGGNEKEQLKTLSDEARGVSEIAKGLADYTRAGHRKTVGPVELDAVLEEVRRDLLGLIQSSGAELKIGPLGTVLCDRTQLRQLFWNLVENAIKFRDPARPLVVEVRRAGSGETAADEPGMLTIMVRDNGLGIPEDEVGRVFEAFHRVPGREGRPGTGLGLSFCRKIVEGAGGRIRLNSREGEGSEFLVTLPLAGSQGS